MNGFRIWTAAADNEVYPHTKRLACTAAKKAPAALLSVCFFFSMAGCGKRTPTYAGPPDTVRQILMKKWEIEPGRIEVPQGARVELVVSSTDVEHGISVPGLGIREPVQPEHPAVIRFLAQTPGVYPMHCSILCGRGHNRMTGEIVITPARSQ